MRKTHTLKTYPEYFQATWDGMKNFEYRKNDRDFEVEDVIILREFDKENGYTRRAITARVDYIIYGGVFNNVGLPSGYCIMGIEPFEFIST